MASIFGTNGADVRDGGGGNDVISGGPAGGNPALEIGADILSGRGGNDTIYGYGGIDRLNGNAGNDRLFGGLGNDIMNGGEGNDVLVGGAGADFMNGNRGNDTVNYALDGGTRGVRVNLLGTGAQGGIAADTAIDSFGFRDTVKNIPNVIGTRFADVIYGGNHANILSGGLGNDKLSGGLGFDTLSGGGGNDVFLFNAPLAAANRDIVTDFANVAGNNDTFHLENAVMTTLGVGPAHALNPAFLRIGAAAADANDHVIYNRLTGALSYDVNGSGAGGVTLLAVLSTRPILTAADFVVI